MRYTLKEYPPIGQTSICEWELRAEKDVYGKGKVETYP
jgi:hypothetical protein